MTAQATRGFRSIAAFSAREYVPFAAVSMRAGTIMKELKLTTSTSTTTPTTNTTFTDLNLNPLLLKALTSEGYTTPTPIQAQAIPSVKEGRDLLGIAQRPPRSRFRSCTG
jgi:hypothetical protein